MLVWKYGFKGRRNALLGSAAFGGIDDVRALASNKGDLLIGRSFRTGKLLRYDGPAHLLTMAPTRSGKGVGTIIPNLLIIDRSVICIDPKGERSEEHTSELQSLMSISYAVFCLKKKKNKKSIKK